MAFDHENHVIDADGFQRHKTSGHLIGIEEAPPVKHPEDGAEWPKWVVPHESHVVRQKRGDVEHISTPHFQHHHVNRADGVVTVLAHDAEEEAKAMAEHGYEAPMGA